MKSATDFLPDDGGLWGVYREAGEKTILHVAPIGDSIEHDLDGNSCICCPRRELTNDGDGVVIVHDALDGRT